MRGSSFTDSVAVELGTGDLLAVAVSEAAVDTSSLDATGLLRKTVSLPSMDSAGESPVKLPLSVFAVVSSRTDVASDDRALLVVAGYPGAEAMVATDRGEDDQAKRKTRNP